MSDKYSIEILIKLLAFQAVVLCLGAYLGQGATATSFQTTDVEPFTTIRFKDSLGRQHVEYAFPAPAMGLPHHALDMFCASVKVSLYWESFREEAKKTHRKGIFLRRMARFAKHIFSEIRDVDKPFNATMLSRVDKYFEAKPDKKPEDEEEFVEDDDDDKDEEHSAKGQGKLAKLKSSFHTTTQKISQKWSSFQAKNLESISNEALDEIETSDTAKELDKQGLHPAIERIKKFAKGWTFKKAALYIYTRWRTMWWLTLSCLYAKYYLWDPALDEFIKLKRSLLMWPELQLIRLQDLSCKPIIFFRRIMDICKILNPLMKIDFGQFNYNTLTRFKGQS